MTARLTKNDWLEAGLRALTKEGPAGLKAARLAARLKVSRGSFYWHFRDIGAFRTALLRAWRERATENVIEALAVRAEPERLRVLLRAAFRDPLKLDRAVRAWAAENAEAARAVAGVDARRVGHIAKLLIAAGASPRRAHQRAGFLYWAYLGRAMVMDRASASIAAEALDDIADRFTDAA